MTRSPRLAVIGGGRMGEAIVAGLLEAGAFEPADVVVAEPSAARRDALAPLRVTTVPSAAEAVPDAGVVLLAVKPQVIGEVVAGIAALLPPDALVVSIAAGVSCSRLESELPAGTAVVRVMPNTPAMVGEAMSVVSGGSDATPEQVERVREMFGVIGKALVLDERFQDAATGISGSGPAYVAVFIDALARAGVRHGLPRDVAQALAVQTLRGTCELLDATGQHPEQLVDAVCSPGGTTIAGVEALEAKKFRAAVAACVAASVARAKELG